jgi:predicted PurR-regulated permease PerM
MALMMFHRIDEQIGGYLRGRLIECMLVGLIQMVLMSVASLFVEQPQILLISVVCGVFTLIPYAGPVIGSAFGVFIYFSGDYPMNSIWALIIVCALAHLIDNIVIAPAVLSHNVNLHPLTVALVLIIGGETMGVLGLLIAIPVASTVKVIAQEFHANYQTQVR